MEVRRGRAAGLTLIEVIIILAVLIILIGLLVPSAVQQLTATRRSTTLDEMDNLKKAMIGDPNLKSQGIRTDFGYLGDMGNLVASLDDLVTQATQPSFAFDSSKRVGAGWKGPYITLGSGADPSSHKRDAFGNDYTYDTTDFTNNKGQAADAKLVTLGADGVTGGSGVDEDITLEVLKAETTATVSGFVLMSNGDPVASAQVFINFPTGGVLTTSTTTTNTSGFYQFLNISFGIRSVQTAGPSALGLVAGSVRATGGSRNSLEFKVENNSGSSITIRSLKAVYNISGVYNEIRWGGTQVFNCVNPTPPPTSGDTVLFSSPQTIAASPSPPSARLVNVHVASSSTRAPDITIQAGAGTQVTVEILDFRSIASGANNCRRGPRPDLTGANFTITLCDVTTVPCPAANSHVITFTVP